MLDTCCTFTGAALLLVVYLLLYELNGFVHFSALLAIIKCCLYAISTFLLDYITYWIPLIVTIERWLDTKAINCDIFTFLEVAKFFVVIVNTEGLH